MSIYSDMALLDLRTIQSVETAKAIEEISDSGMLILPSDGDPAVVDALAQVPKNDIGSTITLSVKDELHAVNGILELNTASVPTSPNAVIACNGVLLVTENLPGEGIRTILNGMLIVKQGVEARIRLLQLNGMKVTCDFEHLVQSGNTLQLSAADLEYMDPKTLIFVGNTLTLEKDVTSQVMKEKQIIPVVGNCLKCYAPAVPYVKAKGIIGNKIEVLEDHGD